MNSQRTSRPASAAPITPDRVWATLMRGQLRFSFDVCEEIGRLDGAPAEQADEVSPAWCF
ncbi:hypothetical protein [Streptomyces sp. NPDC005046]